MFMKPAVTPWLLSLASSGVDTPVHIPLDNFTHKLGSELREHLGNFLSFRGVRCLDDGRGPRPVFDDGVET